MLNIAKLTSGTARAYFREEFAAASNSYFSEDGAVTGRWHGTLARDLGLGSKVHEEHYLRLIEGQHPHTGEQLIHARASHLVASGEEAAHVPAWEIGMGVPKSWSIAAIVGGDQRIYRWAETANREALDALQTYAQARGGGSNRNTTTGSWVVATFRHETARPVDGYSAPQLHFHNVVMNLQHADKFRALHTAEIYRAKSYALQIFYDSLTRSARSGGYEIDIAEGTFAPELRGISEAYRQHESPRATHIEEELDRRGLVGSKASHIVAKQDREAKLYLTPAEFIARQKEHGLAFAPELQIVPAALERIRTEPEHTATAPEAVEHATRSLSERLATFEHYQLARESLRYALGTVEPAAVETEIARRIEAGALVSLHHYRDYAPGARYATREMLELERATIRDAVSSEPVPPIYSKPPDLSSFPELADNQERQRILQTILTTTQRIMALNGAAGSAKSTAAGILRCAAEANGWRVRGLAPTGTAAAELRSRGLESETLHHAIAAPPPNDQRPTLFIVDESSLTSTRLLSTFLSTLRPTDHVLLIGDDAADPHLVGQHTSVEAGRIFQLLQQAGLPTAQFNRIYRQKTPELHSVVQFLRRREHSQAIAILRDGNRLTEEPDWRKRYAKIAKNYAAAPHNTLIVSPDNASRQELNAVIRKELLRCGLLAATATNVAILVPRDVTRQDAQRATSYRMGDVIHYRRANHAIGVAAGSFATVVERDTDNNRITIETAQGQRASYDPQRVRGITIHERQTREFRAGDRLQFLQPVRARGLHTRDTATIRSLDEAGNAHIVLDRNSRTVRANLHNLPHIDYAYAMTSHSSQSKTVDRVLINIPTEEYRLRPLINEVFAYVAASRPRHDLQVFTDNSAELHRVLSRPNEQRAALSAEQAAAAAL